MTTQHLASFDRAFAVANQLVDTDQRDRSIISTKNPAQPFVVQVTNTHAINEIARISMIDLDAA